ncbi:hypothetical protein [Cutibacterium avidum]|uniref:Uncharacterized protein n=1 Tax=Cutibacterium avidum TaxID=33010 RepID=A0A3E2DE29_9ACTN|nr:hypothetical protein [Cutibacterium avidum]MDK7358979.1 hypothetical protein [Cutibacterium avidum]MDK7372777.1 hypothetical protein [Cutibacterium avidum]MDU3219265.1 hypothetical protein [Cutibacterium avidum]MDU5867602.1 hypothetical protein [Cutibacterium avidum]MDU8016066.1 hypothetical protein [Cutibacterium avidum]
MSTYGDLKKAWARLRREYLDGKVLDAVVIPSGTGVRWECPVCGAVGTDVTSSRLATTAGRNHAQTHISADDRAALDALKVTHMPEALLTPSLTSSRLDPIKTTA